VTLSEHISEVVRERLRTQVPQEKLQSQADMIKSTKLVSWEGRMVS